MGFKTVNREDSLESIFQMKCSVNIVMKIQYLMGVSLTQEGQSILPNVNKFRSLVLILLTILLIQGAVQCF